MKLDLEELRRAYDEWWLDGREERADVADKIIRPAIPALLVRAEVYEALKAVRALRYHAVGKLGPDLEDARERMDSAAAVLDAAIAKVEEVENG